eukprot:5224322-Pyramimonas_sp.AAC.2
MSIMCTPAVLWQNPTHLPPRKRTTRRLPSSRFYSFIASRRPRPRPRLPLRRQPSSYNAASSLPPMWSFMYLTLLLNLHFAPKLLGGGGVRGHGVGHAAALADVVDHLVERVQVRLHAGRDDVCVRAAALEDPVNLRRAVRLLDAHLRGASERTKFSLVWAPRPLRGGLCWSGESAYSRRLSPLTGWVRLVVVE